MRGVAVLGLEDSVEGEQAARAEDRSCTGAARAKALRKPWKVDQDPRQPEKSFPILGPKDCTKALAKVAAQKSEAGWSQFKVTQSNLARLYLKILKIIN